MGHSEAVRHLGSILLASIFGPAIFLLTDLGLSGIDSARWGSFTDDPFGPLAALGMLFLAGLIYGVLVMVRLSPVGPGFAGLALMGTSSWAVLDPSSYYETLGTINVHMGGAIGQLGLGMLLGAPLVATLTSPRRWRNAKNGYGDHADTVLSTQSSTSDSTHVMPDLPASKTLPDFVRARAAVPEAPTVLIGPVSAPAISRDPPVSLDRSAGQPLPRRIPLGPPAMRSATSRSDGPMTAPEESSSHTAPTQDIALISGPANTTAQRQTDQP